jgi:cobalt ECF transporter T component CbiQ
VPLAILAGSLILVVVSRLPLRSFLWRATLTIALFGLAIGLPLSLQAVTPGQVVWEPFGWDSLAVSDAGVRSAVMLLLRIGAAVYVTLLWSLTTRWHQLLHSLRTLRLPRWLTTGLILTYRYLFTLIDTLAEMVVARRSRQVGALSAQQARGYAGAGTAVLFAKSLALHEEVYQAMRSRGFDGDLRGAYARGWQLRDSLWLVLALLWIAGAYWVGGWHVG